SYRSWAALRNSDRAWFTLVLVQNWVAKARGSRRSRVGNLIHFSLQHTGGSFATVNFVTLPAAASGPRDDGGRRRVGLLGVMTGGGGTGRAGRQSTIRA